MDMSAKPAQKSAPRNIPRKEWMRTRIGFLDRDDLRMRFIQVAHLASPVSVKILSGTWEQFARNCYYITSDARRILAEGVSAKIYQEDEIFRAEAAIYEEMARVSEYIDRRVAQAEQKLSLAGASLDSVPQNSRGYEAETTTNFTTEYLQIIKKADLYFNSLEYLWVLGELSDRPDEAMRAKLNSERDVRGHLFSITRTSNRHYEIIRRICKEVALQRELAAASYVKRQTARDKQRHKKELKAMAQSVADKEKAKQQKTAAAQQAAAPPASTAAEGQAVKSASHQAPAPAEAQAAKKAKKAKKLASAQADMDKLAANA